MSMVNTFPSISADFRPIPSFIRNMSGKECTCELRYCGCSAVNGVPAPRRAEITPKILADCGLRQPEE